MQHSQSPTSHKLPACRTLTRKYRTTARIIDRMKKNLRDAMAIFSECFSVASQQRLGQEGTSTRIQAFATYSVRVSGDAKCYAR